MSEDVQNSEGRYEKNKKSGAGAPGAPDPVRSRINVFCIGSNERLAEERLILVLLQQFRQADRLETDLGKMVLFRL